MLLVLNDFAENHQQDYVHKTKKIKWIEGKLNTLLGISSILATLWSKFVKFLQSAMKFESFFVPVFGNLV